MLGTMALVGMKLNFMNIMVLVTIVGMGSDYGLHIQHRCAEGSPDQQEQNFIQAARSVLLSALTTVAGFGSLAFTDYGAMSSIGWATNFGIGFTVLAALLLVPATVRLATPRR
jgi:predicted RND superfamily exporter protein